MAQDNYGQYGDWRDRGQAMGERRYGRDDRSRMGRMGRGPEDRSFNEPRYGRDQDRDYSSYRSDRDYQARDYQGYGEDAYDRSRSYGEDDWRGQSRGMGGSHRQDRSGAYGGQGAGYRGDDRWGGGPGWQDRDYGRREDEGRNAWERTRERIGEWFGADRDRLHGQHRGRGPKGYRRSDDRIREDVNDRLTDDPFLDATDIEVQVQGGEVTLGGAVRTREDKRRAEMLAERCSGVDNVQNNLRVENDRRYGQAGMSGAGQSSTVGGTTNPSVMDVSGGGTGQSGHA